MGYSLPVVKQEREFVCHSFELMLKGLAAAWALNPLAVLLAPLGAWIGLDAGLNLARGRGLLHAAPRPALIWLALACALAFGVVRNLPWF